MVDPKRVDLNAPPDVIWIARTLEEAGHATWAVGGAVRDAIRGHAPEDWDLTTSARPGQVQRLFRRTVPIGVEHGTVGVVARSGRMYEVTTFRKDVETFGRRARVRFADTLDEDLERRDFTINAVAWHPLTHEVRDPHEGVRDLAEGTLRTVGDPVRRFQEDRLRALRALRFAGRFGLTIEEATWRAARECAPELKNLSAERIREELWKVVQSPRPPSASLSLYADAGVLAELYPELEACRGEPASPGIGEDLWSFSLRAVDAASPNRPRVRLAALLHVVGRCGGEGAAMDVSEIAAASAAIARELLRRLRFSNADIDRVSHLIAQSASAPRADASPPELRRWIRRVGPDHLHDLFRLLFALARAGEAPRTRSRELRTLRLRTVAEMRAMVPLSIRDLAIDGSDLRSLGLPPGPLYGEILDDLLERVTEEPRLNERGLLLEIVRSSIG